MSFSALWQQFFPPAPTFTEKDVIPGSQAGKVFIVTGATSGTVTFDSRNNYLLSVIILSHICLGLGLTLVELLYPTSATIYLAGRSPKKIQDVINKIVSTSTSTPAPATPAILKPLHLDLSDLTTVRGAAASFAAQESRLDVIWNNAGTNLPPESLTKQGLEAHVGANCVAPLLFTHELLPLLRAAAASAPKNTVRVVWSGSLHIDMTAPKGGVDFARIENPGLRPAGREDYAASKAGNWFLAAEGARRWGIDGIICVCQNPGNLYTPMYDNESRLSVWFLKKFILYEPRYGAYTMLYSGLSPKLTEDHNGAYIWPWGRVQPIARKDILRAASEGKAAEFWEWCERAWKQHA